MASKDPQIKQGLAESANPKAEKRGQGGMPPQEQQWPGTEKAMHPRADHGEETYVGAGKLKGKKALITGGDSGIGKAVAIAFAREGADVAIAYLNEHEDAQDTIQWVKQAGREGLAIRGDLANADHCREVIRQVVEEFGGIDILVNNAAEQTMIEDISEITAEQLERTFRTNFFSFVWLAQAALEHMGEGGVILNTGSVNGFDPSPSLMDYAATKGAIHNFTKSLAKMVADRGIRVNCVAPGPVWTPLPISTMDAETIAETGKSTLFGRTAQPAEIAPSYVFLASADGRYYTGEILAPTGMGTTR